MTNRYWFVLISLANLTNSTLSFTHLDSYNKMRFNLSAVSLTYFFLVCLVIGRLDTLEAAPKASTTSAAPIIGDKDKDGAISQDEAEALIKNTNLKNRLLKGSLDVQTQFYNALEKRIRTKLVRLSRAYDTPKWKFVIEQCKKMGIAEADAVRIAKVITKVRSAK